MPRIAWIEDAEAQGELASYLAGVRTSTGKPLQDVLRTMTLRPDFLVPMREAIRSLNSNEGALTRAQREMIVSQVAALTRCHYCLVNHTAALESYGEPYDETARSLRAGALDLALLTPAERLLLEFVDRLTRNAHAITDEQVQGLRDMGWTDAQIAETVYVGAVSNMIVRLADAFGLELPEEQASADFPAVEEGR
jgi:uncharacterized peroxidase-related enzyme